MVLRFSISAFNHSLFLLHASLPCRTPGSDMYKQTPLGTPSYKKTSWFTGIYIYRDDGKERWHVSSSAVYVVFCGISHLHLVLCLSPSGKRDAQGDEEPEPASYLEEEGETFTSDLDKQQWEMEQEQLDRYAGRPVCQPYRPFRCHAASASSTILTILTPAFFFFLSSLAMQIVQPLVCHGRRPRRR